MARPVVVAIDTTEITSSPMCSGAAWQILAHRRPAWKVRVLTTEIVVEEAIANYARELKPAEESITKFEDKFGRRLGLWWLTEDNGGNFAAVRDGYREKLNGLLRDASVVVVPTTNAPHMDLVRRATTRRRPCNDNGDGYRDTLNWLTVISLARKYPKSDVIWVTGNTKDFQSEDGCGFHEDLVEDLNEAGLTNVRLLTSLQDLAIELVANLGSDEVDLRKAQTELQNDVLTKFIRMELMIDSQSASLEAESCGLPYGTRHAHVSSVSSVNNVEVELIGKAGDETSLLKFSASISAEILVEISSVHDLAFFDETSDADPDTGLVSGSLHKQLKVEGILTIGNYSSPRASEIRSIEAPPGDSGVAAYRDAKRQADAQTRRAATGGTTTSLSRFTRQLAEIVATTGGLAKWSEVASQISAAQASGGLAKWSEMASQISAAQTSAAKRSPSIRLSSPNSPVTQQRNPENSDDSNTQ